MRVLKETFKQYKWVLLAGVIVAVLIALITANLHVLRFIGYKVQNNTEGIISVLESQVAKEDETKDWFFVQGMDYLVGQEEYTEEIVQFFQENFNTFSFEIQKKIIKAYNSRQLNFLMNGELMNTLVAHIDDDVIKAYIKRLKPDELEQGLFLMYGENPAVEEKLVTGLYKVLSIYPQKLNFTKFKFNLYDLLCYVSEEADEQKEVILAKIPTETARESIFSELQSKTITEEEICMLVKFFNDTNLISNSEYATFNNAYSEICVIRNQYKGLDKQEIELQNQKDQVDLQIGDSMKALENKQNEVAAKQNEIADLETKLDEATNYIHMKLYIEQASGTGNNEYIASIPRSGLFGGYKPTSQKYIVKLQRTSNVQVPELSLYFRGSKVGSNGQEYTYYEEVSDSDLANISSLEAQRNTMAQALTTLQSEAAALTNEISAIKEDNNYDETQEALKSIAAKRDELSKQLSEKTITIKELFGLKDLRITLEV